VLAPVAPGLGESPAFADPEEYRPTRLAELVVELTDQLGIEAFDYAGWSWGATIGVHLAARHPERLTALVLLDAGHTDAQDGALWADVTLEERIPQIRESLTYAFPTWDDMLAQARERATAWRPALEERLRAGMDEREGGIVPRADPVAVAAALHWVGVERPSEQLPLLGGHLDLPILLVVATRNDTSAQVERFRSAVPHASIATVDSEHDLLAHAPDETAAVVADWLLERTHPRVA
jgi:pimeloyl-ACP methyl ester carboxylesterase